MMFVAGTRRRSARISLLPGMTPSPVKKAALPVPSDLITWDSPEHRRTSRSAGYFSSFVITL